MKLARRSLLAALAAGIGTVPALLRAEAFAGHYALHPEAVADGIWLVRGRDEAIAFDNGGAIANCAIIATAAGAVLFDCGPSLAYGRALGALARHLVGKPVALVLLSHLHPDHTLGAAAFDPAIVAALPGTIADIERDGPGMTDAMFRILADWMRGTALVLPQQRLGAGPLEIGGRKLQLLALSGHSSCDLAVLDAATGTLIAGDLVFHDRAPATPHADLGQWRQSLDILAAVPHHMLVPGHGPLDSGNAAIAQTRDWLDWMEAALASAASRGLDMTEAGSIAIPPRFAALAEARYELQRSVAHFYPGIEASQLPRID